MLLPACWRLLLETFASRLPRASAARLVRRLRSYGAAWLGALVAALEGYRIRALTEELPSSMCSRANQ